MKSFAPRIPRKQITYRSYKNFVKEDFISDLVSAPFQVTEIFDEPDDTYWAFEYMFNEILNQHLPVKKKMVRNKHTPFMNGRLRRDIARKKRLWKRFKRFPNPKTWEDYRLQRNRATSTRRESIKHYFKERTENGSQNEQFRDTVKPFFTHKGSNHHSDLLIEDEGNLVTNLKDVAEIMNNFYVDTARHIGADKPAPTIDANYEPCDIVNSSIEFYKHHPSVELIKCKLESVIILNLNILITVVCSAC